MAPRKKIPFTVQLEPEALDDFEQACDENYAKPTEFAATLIGKLSQLKPEYLLRVYERIPVEWYKRGRGRPPSTTGTTNTTTAPRSEPAVQDVA